MPLVGFKYSYVSYKRHERIAGESHYPLSKMLGLAMDGITSLSIKPIRLITSLGVLTSLFSFLLIIWVIWSKFAGTVVAGWASTYAIVSLLGGVQLISLGVLVSMLEKFIWKQNVVLDILSVNVLLIQKVFHLILTLENFSNFDIIVLLKGVAGRNL